MRGIQETLDVVAFISELADLIKDSKKSKKLDIFVAARSLKVVPSMVAAVTGSKDIDDELSDLTEEEKTKLLHEMTLVIYKLVEALK